jgi:hypothetical protein
LEPGSILKHLLVFFPIFRAAVTTESIMTKRVVRARSICLGMTAAAAWPHPGGRIGRQVVNLLGMSGCGIDMDQGHFPFWDLE